MKLHSIHTLTLDCPIFRYRKYYNINSTSSSSTISAELCEPDMENWKEGGSIVTNECINGVIIFCNSSGLYEENYRAGDPNCNAKPLGIKVIIEKGCMDTSEGNVYYDDFECPEFGTTDEPSGTGTTKTEHENKGNRLKLECQWIYLIITLMSIFATR